MIPAKVDVLIGLQWGDEGKGKIVDCLSSKYHIIARYQGGPNAGHTLTFNNSKYILHTIPSGIFQPNCKNYIGNGVVIDPIVFHNEIMSLQKVCPWIYDNLIISKHAHLILPTHRLLDAAYEQAKGKDKIGSTLKGIGPCYTDKISRQGIRVGDLFQPNFKTKYQELVQRHIALLKILEYPTSISDLEIEWFSACEIFNKFNLAESNFYIQNAINNHQQILAEGAQGSLLDIDFGSYPYVTSSNTIAAGACTGLGVAPRQIGDVIGIFKAYTTRVGSGPFPTEQDNETGEKLRKIGHEYGSTTGRPRRCGWLDLVALKFAIQINGVNRLIITKSDVLSTFDEIKVAVAYEINDELITHIPYNLETIRNIEYKTFKGWKKDISKAKTKNDLPKELFTFLSFIEEYTNTSIELVSVGPDRNANVWLNN
ncbi:MAG: adenylosuccinate synthase [Bacteroidales bacterium]|nr:adenylosuccinate synthase [Bacteroidales bacterium]